MRTSLFFSYACLLLVFGFASHVNASPDIQTWQSERGAKVLFVENSILPMVDLRIVFDAAGSRDGELPGLAKLTNGLLAEGAAGRDAQAIAESFESVGAQFGNDSLRDMAYVGVRTLSDERYLQTAVDTLADVLTRPDFPQQAFDRELARMKVALEARKQSPSDIAEEAFFKAVYRGHPYASPPGGTELSLDSLGLVDIQSFYERFYVASNAIVVIVGDLDRTAAEAIVETLFENMPSGNKPEPLVPVPELEQAVTLTIDFPSKQSHIVMGQPGMKRNDEDFFELYVANHPFGGSGFASRLVQVVREDRGLAYSVSSYFLPMRKRGPFAMSLQTRTDQAEEALSLLQAELDKYVASGPGADELEASISNITGSFPLSLDSNSKLLGYLAMIGFYDLPLDYLDTYISKVRAVERDDIRSVLNDRLDPERMVTVIVGNGG
ncbi:MAG: insulinase family protein [Gammaproteobacteria bacterium]|nr:insulinase family protein [Gammaproteobacteria bacterium]